jgi:AraC-like DNA-binding protein
VNEPDRPMDRAHLWREPALSNMELLHATFVTHAFGRHAHDEFAIGIIEQGTQIFSYRGEHRLATIGSVVVIEPDEIHTGHAATDEGYRYRMLYPDPQWIQQARAQIAGRNSSLPHFPAPIVSDASLASAIRDLHRTLERPSSRLAREVLFLSVLTNLVERYSVDPPTPSPTRPEHAATRLARDFIEGQYADDLSLDALASLVGLSPYHFLRVFRREIGLPPHAYLDQTRVRHAKRLLAEGTAIADVAALTGFADQSHLTRRFKRLVGVTPGQYQRGSKNLQDSRVHES